MKVIKILTVITLIILITLISFFGIYTNVQNRMEDQIKGYTYSMDLEGNREIRLSVSTGAETIIKDENGLVVETTEELTDEKIAELGYVKETIPYNNNELLNLENYKESEEIIESRLEQLGVSNYILRFDEYTGDIILELTEDENTDYIVANIYNKGNLEIIDSETKEVLMTNEHFEEAQVMYGQSNTTTGGTDVVLSIKFNEEGTVKLKEISQIYFGEKEGETPEDPVETKNITLNIDGAEIVTTGFQTPIENGEIQLSMGTTALDQETLNSNIERATTMEMILDNGKMPLQYELVENSFIHSEITSQMINMVVYIGLGVIIFALLILIIRYKGLGFLSAISYIGFVSLTTLIVRYANVTISIEGIIAFGVIAVLNYGILVMLLEKVKNGKMVRESCVETFKRFYIAITPIIIMTIVLAFTNYIPLISFGMVMFWGLILIGIYNILVTRMLMKLKKGEK